MRLCSARAGSSIHKEAGEAQSQLANVTRPTHCVKEEEDKKARKVSQENKKKNQIDSSQMEEKHSHTHSMVEGRKQKSQTRYNNNDSLSFSRCGTGILFSSLTGCLRDGRVVKKKNLKTNSISGRLKKSEAKAKAVSR